MQDAVTSHRPVAQRRAAAMPSMYAIGAAVAFKRGEEALVEADRSEKDRPHAQTIVEEGCSGFLIVSTTPKAHFAP